MSRKTSIRKVTALVSALLFASSSYSSSAKVIADDIDMEWTTYMNQLTLKYIENENNCRLNFIYNSNSKYDSNTLNKIENNLTRIIFNSELSENNTKDKITSKQAVFNVISIEDGEKSYNSCIHSFSINNTNYYFDLKK